MSAELESENPVAGEEIHLPGPSAIPLLCAIGITLIVVGTTLGMFVTIVGLILFLATTARWIADTRRDIAALPEEHRHH